MNQKEIVEPELMENQEEKTVKRVMLITVTDNGKHRKVEMKIENFAQHDLVGILEVCKTQVISRPPDQMNKDQGASYIG